MLALNPNDAEAKNFMTPFLSLSQELVRSCEILQKDDGSYIALLINEDAPMQGLHIRKEAVDGASQINIGGFTDWRLPNLDDLSNIQKSGIIPIESWDVPFWSSENTYRATLTIGVNTTTYGNGRIKQSSNNNTNESRTYYLLDKEGKKLSGNENTKGKVIYVKTLDLK